MGTGSKSTTRDWRQDLHDIPEFLQLHWSKRWDYEPVGPPWHFQAVPFDGYRAFSGHSDDYSSVASMLLWTRERPLIASAVILDPDGFVIAGFNRPDRGMAVDWFGVQAGYEGMEGLGLPPEMLVAWEAMAKVTCEMDW